MNVFLSYCHEDRKIVTRLRNDLAASGVAVWWDEEILPGQDWQYEIRRAMQTADAVLLCLSQRLESRAVSGMYPEISDAIDALRKRRLGHVFLIPVRISECEIPPLEIDATRRLDRLQYVDLFPESQWKLGLNRLLQTLKIAAPSAENPTEAKSHVMQVIASRARNWSGNNLAQQPYYPIPYHEQIIDSLMRRAELRRGSGGAIL